MTSKAARKSFVTGSAPRRQGRGYDERTTVGVIDLGKMRATASKDGLDAVLTVCTCLGLKPVRIRKRFRTALRDKQQL